MLVRKLEDHWVVLFFSTLNAAGVFVDDEVTVLDTARNHEISRLTVSALQIGEMIERDLPTSDLVDGRIPLCDATIRITAEDEADAIAVLVSTVIHRVHQNVLAKRDAHGIGERAFLGCRLVLVVHQQCWRSVLWSTLDNKSIYDSIIANPWHVLMRHAW